MTTYLDHHPPPEWANLRAELARAAVRQRELVLLLGVPQPGITNRLSGLIAFQPGELDKIAEYLDVDPAIFRDNYIPYGVGRRNHAGRPYGVAV